MIAIIAVLAVAVIGVSAWLITVDVQSRPYNLITIDTKDVPSQVTAAAQEYDIGLSGVTMHYAVYGEGRPLILIHGNGGSHKSLEDAAKYLANDYKVYAIDSRCQGESSETPQISYDLMAADVKEFIQTLGLEKPYVIGHSDGGITALTIASTYPDLLGGFIACGANSVPAEFKWYFTLMVKLQYKRSNSALDKMMLTQPNLTAEKLADIKVPAFIVAGEFDIVKLKDTAFLANGIKNSKVAIIKWANHSSYMHNGKKAYALAKSFFGSLPQA